MTPSPFARILRTTIVAEVLLLMSTAFAEAEKPDHSLVPGVVVAHLPQQSGCYIGSPGLAVLPDGSYVASHDIFGPKSSYTTRARTGIYRSTDRGKTWRHLAWIDGALWSSLFIHRDALYLLGTDKRYGKIVIRRSGDGGKTWTEPTAASGILRDDAQYHCAPVPVIEHGGRLWRAFEIQTGSWPEGFQAFVISAPAAADLLDPDSWTFSNCLPWPEGVAPRNGWLEGNVVVTPTGDLWDILRVNDQERGGKAAITTVSADGKTLAVDPETFLIDFPGGCKKFTIRHDPKSGLYWSLTNYIPPEYAGHDANMTRNTLALISSKDLRDWQVRDLVLQHKDWRNVGWQYIEWHVDGEDLIFLSRTAHPDGLGGARNCHDANYLTFHRLENFRQQK